MSLTQPLNFSGSFFQQFDQIKQKDWQKEANIRGCHSESFGRSKKFCDFDK